MVLGEIAWSCADGVATIALNRPERLNAIGQGLREELRQALRRARDESAVRVLVLTGLGRAFCVGADFKELAALDPAETDNYRQMGLEAARERIELLFGLGKPAIAAINGPAVGGGLSLALACDIRVAVTSAQLGAPFVGRGLMADGGLTWLLPRLVGTGRAAKLLLSGELIDAPTALTMGLVDQVEPGETFAEAVRELAIRIAANAPLALRHSKTALYASLSGDLAAQFELEAASAATLMRTDDFREGVRAFVERRPAVYRGR
jgi:enoyl-CoA hydratase